MTVFLNLKDKSRNTHLKYTLSAPIFTGFSPYAAPYCEATLMSACNWSPSYMLMVSVSIQRTIVERHSIKHVLDRETAESHGKP